MTGNLIFTDNTLDIGATGATRPRTIFVGTSVVTPLLNNTGSTITLRGVTYTLPAADGTNTYVLQTNGSGALTWVPQSTSSSNMPLNPQTTDYTLVAADKGKLVQANKATAINITLPPTAGVYVAGDTGVIEMMGVGATTLVAGSSVTFNRAGLTSLAMAGQYQFVTWVMTGTNAYELTGGLTSTKPTVVQIVVDAPDTALTVAEAKAVFRVPSTLTGKHLTGVAAHVCTVSSSGAPAIQVRSITGSYDMLSTALTIDASEKDSATAATAAVIDTASSHDVVTTADEIAIDCDTAGTGTKGLIVELQFT
jgi:hypothetical protein